MGGAVAGAAAGASSWAVGGAATTSTAAAAAAAAAMPAGLLDVALVGGGCCCCLLAVSLLWAGRWRKDGAGAGAGAAGGIGAYADLVLQGLIASMASLPAARPRAVADERSASMVALPAKADPRPPVQAAAAAASPPLPAAVAAGAAAGAPIAAAGARPMLKHRAVVPRHIAVIMDGNRRFGRERFADPLKGHEEGGRTLSDFTRWCMERGVRALTAYAFSTENWKRDPTEVNALMHIFCRHAEKMREEALAWGVRVRVLCSDPARIPSHVLTRLRALEEATAGTAGNGDAAKFTLNLCVSYGARGEIANACRRLAARVATGDMAAEAIDEAAVAGELLTAGTPDPDLLIRTSGECRVSNFLLFQLAYAEMVFLPKRWPEVTEVDLDAILDDYAARERRYGS